MRNDGSQTATSVRRNPQDGIGAANDERCPSCDSPVAWEVSRRHRFSPFGSVLLAVLSFWTAVFGWLLGIGFVPALVLFVTAVVIGVATRKAEICGACGYVRPQRR